MVVLRPVHGVLPATLAAQQAGFVWGVLHAVRSVPRIQVFKATEDGGW
jgi:hypothetical protein